MGSLLNELCVCPCLLGWKAGAGAKSERRAAAVGEGGAKENANGRCSLTCSLLRCAGALMRCSLEREQVLARARAREALGKVPVQMAR
jgi:hypothetical protein